MRWMWLSVMMTLGACNVNPEGGGTAETGSVDTGPGSGDPTQADGSTGVPPSTAPLDTEAPPPCEDAETMVLWAADGVAELPMEIVPAEQLMIDVARSWSAGMGTLTLSATTTCAGPLYAWGLVWDQSGGIEPENADSLFVSIDGQDEVVWNYGCDTPTSDAGAWAWVAVQASGDAVCEQSVVAPIVAEGMHTIVLRNRENGVGPDVAAIGAVVISHDPSVDPTTLYDPASGGG